MQSEGTVEGEMLVVFFFFFKQKTAYEIMPSLVGSEMCIRDRPMIAIAVQRTKGNRKDTSINIEQSGEFVVHITDEAVSYTHLTLPSICSV
ncbi:hypothetical protein CDFC105_64560 [Clostridioides difficile]|nr:hypothetical protein CDFC105_64560 [Clostridioides difficile]